VIAQTVQLLGAAIILAAFAGSQTGHWNSRAPLYLILNMVGSAVLAVEAERGHQWGFLALEGVWSLTSLAGLVTMMVRPPGTAGPAPAPANVEGDAEPA
jgi:membrane-bound ClpP family serine protease